MPEGGSREESLKFLAEAGTSSAFELLHSMRRWYSGQTMGKNLVKHRSLLAKVMDIAPEDAVGVFRGLKVPKKHPLASAAVGQVLDLPTVRNKGLSSWTETESAADRFSGGGKGKVGLVVKLVAPDGVQPVLAPPTKTRPWFNDMYAHVIGKSFRPTEGEYVLSGPQTRVEVVRVKTGR